MAGPNLSRYLGTLRGLAYESSASFNRTADTNAYLANDVVGAATGSTAALTFAGIGPTTGGKILITRTELRVDRAAVPSGMTTFRLDLYNVTPPSALGDNAAHDIPSGDRASYLGYLDLGAPVARGGSSLYIDVSPINKQFTVPSGGSLFGYLVTVGAYTPASATPHMIRLHSVGL